MLLLLFMVASAHAQMAGSYPLVYPPPPDTQSMQLGSCYQGGSGARAFAAKLGLPKNYDPKDVRYTRWRLGYSGHNNTHVWMDMACTTTSQEEECRAVNIANHCTGAKHAACGAFEEDFFPKNIYFYAGTELQTSLYPARITMDVTDRSTNKSLYSGRLVRRVYSQSKSQSCPMIVCL